MRHLVLAILIFAGIFSMRGEEFTVRVHVKEHATGEHMQIDRYDLDLYKNTPAKKVYMDSLVTQNEDGVFELKFDHKPQKKEYWLLMQCAGHRSKDLYVDVPKRAKSPYDMDVKMWRRDEYNTFDPAKSFTVIMHTKDSLTNEPVSTGCRINFSNGYDDWRADVKTIINENGEIKIVFRERPKANEKYELLIWPDKSYRKYLSGGGPKPVIKHVTIEIPKKAKSPYTMPDVLMVKP